MYIHTIIYLVCELILVVLCLQDTLSMCGWLTDSQIQPHSFITLIRTTTTIKKITKTK